MADSRGGAVSTDRPGRGSPRAVPVGIAIVRLRRLLDSDAELAQRLVALENEVRAHDTHLLAAFQTIRKLMQPELPESRRRIGFRDDDAER